MAISIHAPIVGCDINPTFSTSFFGVFQSTHPSWGATRSRNRKKRASRNFNPRTHRGVRQCNIIIFLAHFDISIHAPIVGCDFISVTNRHKINIFQSTHPSWGATKLWWLVSKITDNFNPRTHRGVRRQMRKGYCWGCFISIHAPIVGCDDFRR